MADRKSKAISKVKVGERVAAILRSRWCTIRVHRRVPSSNWRMGSQSRLWGKLMVEVREVLVCGEDGSTIGQLIVSTEPPWKLRLGLDGREYAAVGDDLFDCLNSIRHQLEREGRQICCQGARSDVYPSGMTSQMSGGRKAYRLYRDRKSTLSDVVDIFDPEDCRGVTTVQEQEITVRRLREH